MKYNHAEELKVNNQGRLVIGVIGFLRLFYQLEFFFGGAGAAPTAYEGSQVQSELQLPAYVTAIDSNAGSEPHL